MKNTRRTGPAFPLCRFKPLFLPLLLLLFLLLLRLRVWLWWCLFSPSPFLLRRSSSSFFSFIYSSLIRIFAIIFCVCSFFVFPFSVVLDCSYQFLFIVVPVCCLLGGLLCLLLIFCHSALSWWSWSCLSSQLLLCIIFVSDIWGVQHLRADCHCAHGKIKNTPPIWETRHTFVLRTHPSHVPSPGIWPKPANKIPIHCL